MAFLQRTMNRGSVSTGYDIDNSLKIEADNAERIMRSSSHIGTPTSTQKATMSFWLKRTELASGNHLAFVGNAGAEYNWVGFNNNNLYIYGGTSSIALRSTAFFRDTSAWYHIVVAYDTTQSTGSNRVKAYVNGVQITAWGVQEDYGTQNNAIGLYDVNLNHYLGWSDAQSQSGYYAEFYLIDGQQLAPTEFGEFDSDTGIWIPKEYTGTFGNEGYYLDFEDSSNLGLDVSGNSNNFGSLYGVSAADQATDTPTNNFATLNQLQLDGSVINNSATITEGATKATAKEFDVFNTFASTIGVTSGKWYAEFEYEGSQADNLVGILDIDAVVPYNSRLGKAGQWSVGFYQANGKLYVTADSGVTSIANWGASATNGDIISVAVDMDNHFVYFAKNGTYQNSGVPTSGATGTGGVAFDSNKTVGIGCSSYDQGGDEGQIFTNYGGFTAGTISSAASDANGYGTFEYAPPSGYYALCGKNLAEYGGTA